MSFNKFYKKRGFSFKTSEIDARISCEEMQDCYYSDWVGKYKKILKSCSDDEIGEWQIRSNKSIWEIYTSGTILFEAKCSLNNKCFASFYFDLYYALFHAIDALLYLTPSIEFDSLFRISHSKLLKDFISVYTGKKSLFGPDDISLFEELKYKREYFSYNTPLNLVFEKMQEDYDKTEKIIEALFQTVALHDFIAFICGRTVSHKDGIDIELFYKKFKKYFSNVDIIDLETQKADLVKKKKNITAKYNRWTEKKEKLIEDLKNGKIDVDQKQLQEASCNAGEAKKQLDETIIELNRVSSELSQVVLDDAAKNKLDEISWGRTLIGITPIVFELDHIFDEFHSYDSDEMYKDNTPIDFSPVDVSSFVMDTILG